MRVGHGYDAHRFASGDHVILGGVKISYSRGLAAHSDGDVLIHALCDALLGAAAMGDIGRHFPDTEDAYAGIDSRILLRKVVDALAGENLTVSNADMTVVAQQPRLGEYIKPMAEILASDLRIDVSRVNVKATTTEKMGFTGRGEGIAAHAVVLLDEPGNPG